jgi:hypothetical protein
MLIRGGCSAESCSGRIQNSTEKGISRGKVFALAVLEIRRAPHVFFYCFAHFPVVMVRVATLLIYLTKNPPNYSPCCISRRAKLNTAGAKTALREILLHL